MSYILRLRQFYNRLLKKGIDGFWNDMNEPAIFYSQKRLEKVFDELDTYRNQNLSVDRFFKFQNLAPSLSNNEEDYRSFYHNYQGQRIWHDKVHNLFGFYMTRSAAEAFEELEPEKRILLFSQASYIGMHRYAGIWQGDNRSWWSHLLMNIKMMPSLNMCGFLYTGADLGGFGGDATEDLVIRWLSFGIFTPLMRNHSAVGTRRQEAYQFARTDLFRNVLLMIGENIMITPVYEQNAEGRAVYLPERMKMLRFGTDGNIEESIWEKGFSYVEEVDFEQLKLYSCGEEVKPYEYYTDNGETKEYSLEKHIRILQ